MYKLKFFILVSALLCATLFSACTDYAQKIEDEYGPAKDESMDSGKDISNGYLMGYVLGRFSGGMAVMYRLVSGGSPWQCHSPQCP